MRGLEWTIAIFLVIIGVCCMALSGTLMLHPSSLLPYLGMLFGVCIWAGIPIAVIGAIYIMWLFKHRK